MLERAYRIVNAIGADGLSDPYNYYEELSQSLDAHIELLKDIRDIKCTIYKGLEDNSVDLIYWAEELEAQRIELKILTRKIGRITSTFGEV